MTRCRSTPLFAVHTLPRTLLRTRRVGLALALAPRSRELAVTRASTPRAANPLSMPCRRGGRERLAALATSGTAHLESVLPASARSASGGSRSRRGMYPSSRGGEDHKAADGWIRLSPALKTLPASYGQWVNSKLASVKSKQELLEAMDDIKMTLLGLNKNPVAPWQ